MPRSKKNKQYNKVKKIKRLRTAVSSRSHFLCVCFHSRCRCHTVYSSSVDDVRLCHTGMPRPSLRLPRGRSSFSQLFVPMRWPPSIAILVWPPQTCLSHITVTSRCSLLWYIVLLFCDRHLSCIAGTGTDVTLSVCCPQSNTNVPSSFCPQFIST